jgi:hypothetical protein
MSRNSGFFLALAGCALLAGCADYLNRYDTVTLAAGDAPKSNILLHTVDPFNPDAANTAISTNGVVAAGVIRKYQTPQQGSQPAQNVTVNVGATN